MNTDADVVLKVARQMMSKHGVHAFRRAEIQAGYLHKEPRAAARWHLVADAITLLSEEGLRPVA